MRTAMAEAERLHGWYARKAAANRRMYWGSEVVVILVSASIPIVAIIAPSDALVPAVLGAVVVVVAGLRGLFRWQENWIRYVSARTALGAEMRSFATETGRYRAAASREGRFATRVSEIEASETANWVALRSPGHDDD